MSEQTIWKARELEILQLLSEGLTDSEIGQRLHLAHETVRWYNKQIYEKLGVSNRTQAARRAASLGLLQKADPPSVVRRPFIRPPIRYVANGDVHIAYTAFGDGPVDLLFIHGFLSHLELAWEEPGFVSFFEHLSRNARVILFDKRGVGLSDRIQGAPTLENTLDDARAVLDAVDSERAYIMGTSESGAAAVLLASTYPERVQGLILYAASPKLVSEGDDPTWAARPDEFERFIQGMQQAWGGPWAVEGFAPSRAGDERFRSWWARILRSASSPSSVRTVLTLQREIDIRQLLPQVRVRTLVMHKTDDRMVNVAAGRYMAGRMPNAVWLQLSGADHIYFVDSEAILKAIADFIGESSATHEIDTWIAIILVLKIAHGPAPGTLQQTLHDFRPRHAISDNDGLMALFDSPTRAVQCARRLRDIYFRDGARICLHVGECDVVRGEPTRVVARTARQVADMAAPGEILLTRTLRDILAGAGLTFQAHESRDDGHSTEEVEALFSLD